MHTNDPDAVSPSPTPILVSDKSVEGQVLPSSPLERSVSGRLVSRHLQSDQTSFSSSLLPSLELSAGGAGAYQRPRRASRSPTHPSLYQIVGL